MYTKTRCTRKCHGARTRPCSCLQLSALEFVCFTRPYPTIMLYRKNNDALVSPSNIYLYMCVCQCIVFYLFFYLCIYNTCSFIFVCALYLLLLCLCINTYAPASHLSPGRTATCIFLRIGQAHIDSPLTHVVIYKKTFPLFSPRVVRVRYYFPIFTFWSANFQSQVFPVRHTRMILGKKEIIILKSNRHRLLYITVVYESVPYSTVRHDYFAENIGYTCWTLAARELNRDVWNESMYILWMRLMVIIGLNNDCALTCLLLSAACASNLKYFLFLSLSYKHLNYTEFTGSRYRIRYKLSRSAYVSL